jgi:hypothetical protein
MSRIIACSKRKGLPRPYSGPVAEEVFVVPVRICPLIAKISRLTGDAKEVCCPRGVN